MWVGLLPSLPLRIVEDGEGMSDDSEMEKKQSCEFRVSANSQHTCECVKFSVSFLVLATTRSAVDGYYLIAAAERRWWMVCKSKCVAADVPTPTASMLALVHFCFCEYSECNEKIQSVRARATFSGHTVNVLHNPMMQFDLVKEEHSM